MNIQLKRVSVGRSEVGPQDGVETQVYAQLWDANGTHTPGVDVEYKAQVNAKGVRRSGGAGEPYASNPYSAAIKRARSSHDLDPTVQSVPILAESSPFVESARYLVSPRESAPASYRDVPHPTSQPIPTQADFDDAVKKEVEKQMKRLRAEDPRAELLEQWELRAEIIKTAVGIGKKTAEIQLACRRVAELAEQFIDRAASLPE